MFERVTSEYAFENRIRHSEHTIDCQKMMKFLRKGKIGLLIISHGFWVRWETFVSFVMKIFWGYRRGVREKRVFGSLECLSSSQHLNNQNHPSTPASESSLPSEEQDIVNCCHLNFKFSLAKNSLQDSFCSFHSILRFSRLN